MTTTHVPIRVRARLAGGIAHATPWGIALDGLLAAQLWPQIKAARIAAGTYTTRALREESPPDLELPLARCTRAGGDLWHWAATCAFPEHATGQPDVHTWIGRTDHRDLEHVADWLPKTVSDRQGRYRSHRMPLLVTACSAVTWHALGDPAAVADLLADVSSIGKKRATGEGHVLAWDIETVDGLDEFTAGHLHPDGTLGRPTPQGCLPTRGPGTSNVGTAGIRPPYMHPARQHEVALPAR